MGEPILTTTVLLLPIRRMRKIEGSVMIDDDNIMYDLCEEGLE